MVRLYGGVETAPLCVALTVIGPIALADGVRGPNGDRKKCLKLSA